MGLAVSDADAGERMRLRVVVDAVVVVVVGEDRVAACIHMYCAVSAVAVVVEAVHIPLQQELQDHMQHGLLLELQGREKDELLKPALQQRQQQQ